MIDGIKYRHVDPYYVHLKSTMSEERYHFFLGLFIYFEKESVSGGVAEREEKENPKQAPRCQHRAQHGATTLRT